MTQSFSVKKRDAQRLAAARGVKYTVALRELSTIDPSMHHAVVLQAQSSAPGGRGPRLPSGGVSRRDDSSDLSVPWYERVARDYAQSLLRMSVDDVLTPPPGVFPDMQDAEYTMAGASVEGTDLVDEYEDGAQMYNVAFTLDVTVTGVLTTYVPLPTLEAAGITGLGYSWQRPKVRMPVRQVRVVVAGLLDRGNDDLWEEQEVLEYAWEQ